MEGAPVGRKGVRGDFGALESGLLAQVPGDIGVGVDFVEPLHLAAVGAVGEAILAGWWRWLTCRRAFRRPGRRPSWAQRPPRRLRRAGIRAALRGSRRYRRWRGYRRVPAQAARI